MGRIQGTDGVSAEKNAYPADDSADQLDIITFQPVTNNEGIRMRLIITGRVRTKATRGSRDRRSYQQLLLLLVLAGRTDSLRLR